MFSIDMEETRSGLIEIKDSDGDTVDSMLAYIYTGKEADMDGNADSLSDGHHVRAS